MTGNQPIEQTIQDRYAQVARSTLSSHHAGVASVAQAFSYSEEELHSIPAEANMGLSCGNPTAMASLRPGETVVDLGCGGGLDVFLAAQKVGPAGKAIGIDMTPAMIDRANANAASGADGKPFTNVAFHLAHIDALPLPANSVDCVISNCVINLAPDKPTVFREIARVLKPGGRVAVSDIALKKPLPDELARNISAWVGCISGAIAIEDYRQGLRAAGFSQVEIVDSQTDLNAYGAVGKQSVCCSPAMENAEDHTAPIRATTVGALNVLETNCCGQATSEETGVHDDLATLAKKYDLNEYAASVKVFAVKPG